jgi:hypothetical protein
MTIVILLRGRTHTKSRLRVRELRLPAAPERAATKGLIGLTDVPGTKEGTAS